MIREDIVNSAVSFLQDPNVASAPLDKRIAFLQSKNLTQEEIDVSLAHAGDGSAGSNSAMPMGAGSANYGYQQQMIRQPPQAYGQYGQYGPGFWQPNPPVMAQRDWRDWFIMATVMGSVSYGLYAITKRYIYPLIAPPTPPQLEQDKQAIDESFNRAFALLDQLATDTEALKSSENERTKRLDVALAEVESVISELKSASRRREDEGRRLNDEVRGLKDLIPKAMEAQKENNDKRLTDLNTELRSLKTLMNNRMSTTATPSPSLPRPVNGANMFGSQGNVSVNGATGNPPSTSGPANSAADSQVPPASSGSSTGAPERAQSASPFGRTPGARAAIPAWQMAAAKKNQDAASTEKKEASSAESGTTVDTGT